MVNRPFWPHTSVMSCKGLVQLHVVVAILTLIGKRLLTLHGVIGKSACVARPSAMAAVALASEYLCVVGSRTFIY